MRRPNAVKALHNAVRDAVEQHASALTEQGPQIDALLNAMAAVDEALLVQGGAMQASLLSGATPQCDPIVRLRTSRIVRLD